MQPSNRLHIESLNEEWRDKDEIMLHACFQILKDCIEKEKLLTGHVDWDADEKHQKAKAELELLYNWWIERLKVDDSVPVDDQYEQDNAMLHRLIEIRWSLWT